MMWLIDGKGLHGITTLTLSILHQQMDGELVQRYVFSFISGKSVPFLCLERDEVGDEATPLEAWVPIFGQFLKFPWFVR